MNINTIQNQFYKFHDAIRLEVEDNEQLLEKRDMLLAELEAYIKKMCEDKEIDLITFDSFAQGSYPMNTGIKPMYDEDDYDIDIGLLFHVSKDDYSPIEVKQWVYDCFNAKNFRTVEWKKPCIRVQYHEEGNPKFHIDFAVYSDSSCNSDGKIYLAKGKPTLSKENNFWEVSEPKTLKSLINNKYTDTTEKQQFKRNIRYLKRWKDYKFDSVNGKPTGIALTALAYNGFKTYVKNVFTGEEEINDLAANLNLVNYILGQFGPGGRITVSLPVPPHNDLFEKMTDDQCRVFREKLLKLKDSLERAQAEVDPHEACKILRKEFGDDFPVPPKESTAVPQKKSIVGSTESA